MSDFSQPDADLDPQKVPEEHRDYSESSDEGENEAKQDADTSERDD